MADSATVFGGLGGLFSGFQNGLQILMALQKAEEDRKLRQGELDVNKGHLALDTQKYQDSEADKPYTDIQQNVLKPQNAQASLPDIRREFTPPNIGDTYQPVTQFKPPAFGKNFRLTPPNVGDPYSPTLTPGTASPLQIDTTAGSHLAQVLERAQRYSKFDTKQDILGSTLAAAGREAQATQAPVAGHFGSGADEGQLPSGFSVTPDKTFSPWQNAGRPDPLDNIFGKLLTDPIAEKELEALAQQDPNGEAANTLNVYRSWKQRRFGAGAAPAPTGAGPGGSTHSQRRAFGNPTPPVDIPTTPPTTPNDSSQVLPRLYKGKTIAQWIAGVKADSTFAGASPQDIAAEAKRRAGVTTP